MNAESVEQMEAVLWCVVFSLGVVSLTMKFPLALGLLLLGVALCCALLTVGLVNVVWYAYVFFIVMVGGVLVLFLYMASISPSDGKVDWSWVMVWGGGGFWFGLMIVGVSTAKIEGLSWGLTMENMYSYPHYVMVLFTVVYLLMAFLVVVGVVHISEGPLRAL